MHFAYDARTEELRGRLLAFMDEHVLPAEPVAEEQRAAVALEAGGRVEGVDRNAWAVAEANWTYNELGLRGRARPGDVVRDFHISKFPN